MMRGARTSIARICKGRPPSAARRLLSEFAASAQSPSHRDIVPMSFRLLCLPLLSVLTTATMSAPTPTHRTLATEATDASAASNRAVSGFRAPSDSADVAQVVMAFHAALANGDSAAVMALLATDAVIQESGGVELRAEYQQHHLPGDIRFARAVPGVRSAQRVVVIGDAAWSSSTSVTKGTYRDRVINSVGAELMILSRQGNSWRIRAIHWSSRTPRS